MSLAHEVADLIAGHQIANRRTQQPQPLPCVIANATFNPKDGTVKVYLGHELIQYLDNGNEMLPPEKIPTYGPFPLATMGLGMQAAPVGGERGLLLPIHGSAVVLLLHYDDSPGINAGEWIAQHPRNADTSFYDLRNDGTATHSAKTKAIVTAPQVLLGETQSQQTDGVMNQDLTQKVIDLVTQHVQAAFNQLAQTVQPGSGVPPPTVEASQVQGSTVVFATSGNNKNSGAS